MTLNRPSLLANSIVSVIALSGLTSAQAADDSKNPARLEHILVVGEKLERPYMETFSSVGVVTAAEMDLYDIADTNDVYKRLANVRAFGDSTGTNSISIRGVQADGITQPTGSTATISVIVDGVTQSVEALKRGSRGLWDVEQIEVHRGPQGTTQGRNALAGTVVIKSKDPVFEPEANFRALAGELDRREAALAVSAPIIDDELAFRLSGEYAEKTSDINFADQVNEEKADDEYHNVRGKLLYKPQSVEGLEVLLTVSDVFDSPTNAQVTGPDFFDREFAADSTFAEFREMSLQNYSADVAYALNDGITLRSVTGYIDTDLAISGPPASSTYLRNDHREDGDLTQDLRLEFDHEGSGLSGVAGLFYGSFEQNVDSYILYYGSMVAQDGTFENDTESKAVYADLRYRFNDALSVIFGGRYQDDTVRNAADFVSDFGAGGNSDLESDFSVFLPKLGVAYDLSDNQALAFTASRGYRQGFAETRLGTNDVADVDPEFVWTYELAWRMTSPSKQLQLGANLFYNDYKDQQVAIVNPAFAPLTETFNAGESSSWGMEVEAQYAFNNGLSVYAALGLLETELDDFPAEECTNGSCNGNQFSEAPELTASLGGDYSHASGFFASLAASYTDEFYTDVDNSSTLKVESNVVVNAKVGYDFDHYRISLYANNLFDEDYLTAKYSEDVASVGDGRAVGVEVGARF